MIRELLEKIEYEEGVDLWKGNVGFGEAGIRAGSRFYAGYPITPQNEVPEYLSVRLPEVGGVFVQAESELAAINMVFGASSAGARAMTSTSSPGYSLMQEGVSYLAGAHLPAVIANFMRGGPGLGNIDGAQADYFQAVKGGGHGDYNIIVLAPSTVQEIIDLTYIAFDLADHYRIPVLILADGVIGQMMESARMPKFRDLSTLPPKPWALTGAKNRPKNVIRSLWLTEDGVEKNNIKLQEKYKIIKKEEVYYKEYFIDEDTEFVFVAYGISARIVLSAIDSLRSEGYMVGLLNPITLWPYPYERLETLASSKKVKGFFVVEMSAGQMLEDVRLAVEKYQKPVGFHGRLGGRIPEVDDVIKLFKEFADKSLH